MMSKVFIDADAFVAIWDKKDSNHKKVLFLVTKLDELEIKVFTSDFAFGEVITIISQNAGKKKALSFIKYITTSEIGIERNTEEREDRAIEQFKKFASKNTRFTDCLNMVIMKELGIDTIFSFDKHYKKAGFNRFGID